MRFFTQASAIRLLARRTAGLLALFAWASLTACNDSGSVSAPAVVGAQTNAAQVAPSEFKPLAARPSVDPMTQAFRDKLLGPGATDPSVVNIWWTGVSSFIMAMGGHLFFLDAWEIVGLHANYLPITRDDLAALKPEAIFVGHGHFDHAADVGYVASKSGATVIGGETVCATARTHAQQEGLAPNFPCVALGSQSTPPIGTSFPLTVFEDLPPVTVLHHVHSAAEPEDLVRGGGPLLYVPDLVPYVTHLNTSPGAYKRFAQSVSDDGGVGEPKGGTWAYQFRIGDFSLFWHDSAGPIDVSATHGAVLQKAISDLPGCVDVQLNAIVGFSLFASRFRDALLYVKSARPKVQLPTHHDAWAPFIGGGAAAYESAWRAAVQSLDRPPEVDYLKDPGDYIKKRSYRVDDPRWAGC